MSDNRNQNGGLSRRHWLQLTGAAGAGVLAGCSGDTGSESTTTTTTTTEGGGGGGDETTEETTTTTEQMYHVPYRFQNRSSAPINQTEANPWTTAAVGEVIGLLEAQLTRWSYTSRSEYKYAAEEWEVDQGNNQFRVKLKSPMTWSSGMEELEEVTGEDLAIQQELNRRMVPKADRAENPLITGWHSDGPNDKWYVVDLNEKGYNDAIAEDLVLHNRISVYRNGWFADKLEELKSASSKDARQQVRKDIQQYSKGVLDGPFSGLWKVKEASAKRLNAELKESVWAREFMNYDRMSAVQIGGGKGASWSAFTADQVDIQAHGVPPAITDPPDWTKDVLVGTPTGYGQGLVIPYQSPADPVFWKDLKVAAKVRQALAYAVDKKEVAQAQFGFPEGVDRPPQAKPYQRISGLASEATAKDLFPDLFDSLPTYDQDMDKAASLLKEVGFTKDGGTWHKPNGNTFSFSVQSFSWVRNSAQSTASQLQQFGVKAQHEPMTNNQLVSKYWGTREYQSVIAETSPHTGPPSTYAAEWFDPVNSRAAPPEGAWPVPPMGEFDAEPTESIDAWEAIKNYRTTKESELKDAVKKCVWTYAYHLPVSPYYYWPVANAYNQQHFEWPDAPDGTFVEADENDDPYYGIAHTGQMAAQGVRGMKAKEPQS